MKGNNVHYELYMNQSDKSICSQMELLRNAAECGIIDLDSVLDMYMSNKREQVKKIHPYAMTPPTADGDRWQTCYKDEKGKRKNIKAQTQEELLDKLIPIYFSKTHIEKLIFHELFVEWLDYKATVVNSPNTIKRHKQHYKKYFEASRLHNMKITRIDELLLEQECNRIVKEFNSEIRLIILLRLWNTLKRIVTYLLC